MRSSMKGRFAFIFVSVTLCVSATQSSFAFGRKKAPEQLPGTGTVVMIPGAGSSGDSVYVENIPLLFGDRYFGTFEDKLTEAGIRNLVCPRSHDDDSRTISERAEECVRLILENENKNGSECKPGSVRDLVIMGHSMGGLVARV